MLTSFNQKLHRGRILRWRLLLVAVLTVTAVAFGRGLFPTGGLPSLPSLVGRGDEPSAFNLQPLATPTPFPFQELTIPYLRGRSYESRLGPLAKVGESGNYTTYLTSFNSDELRVWGLLAVPRGNMPSGGFQGIIFIHGYIPPQRYQTLVNYSSYVEALANNGFVVFKIDLRGHGDSEGESGGAYYSGDYVIDTLNAYSALQSSGFVNPSRIGLWGHSMAGNIVFRSFVGLARIPAIVIWAGAGYSYTDLQDYSISDVSYQPPPADSERARKRRELRELYGDFDLTSEFWRQVVPTNYLSDLRGAVQLHHAIDDTVVSIDYSRNLMRILEPTTIYHELYEYQNGGHNLTGAAFTQAMQRTAEFFKRHL